MNSSRATFVDDLAHADRWHDYYAVYADYYEDVLARRLCLGSPTMASSLHHTVIPDATGTVFARVNWAIYSQPTAEGLALVAPAVVEGIARDPWTRRAHRYLFDARGVEESGFLRPQSIPQVDVWYGDLASLLDAPLTECILRSNDILFGNAAHDIGDSLADALHGTGATRVNAAIDAALSSARDSIVPRNLRRPLVVSSIVLFAALDGLDLQWLRTLQLPSLALGVRIAAHRAKASSLEPALRTTIDSMAAIEVPESFAYRIAVGDTLARIVRAKYHQPLSDIWQLIKALNPELRDENKIRAGCTIRLPQLDSIDDEQPMDPPEIR